MPAPVACPVCGADGTVAANAVLAHRLAGQSPGPAPIALRPAVAIAAAPVAVAAPAPEPEDMDEPVHAAAAGVGRETSEADTWKWWYFVLAGICIAGYSVWQAYTQQRLKPLGELFFAALCIAIGIWDFQSKRKKRAGR